MHEGPITADPEADEEVQIAWVPDAGVCALGEQARTETLRGDLREAEEGLDRQLTCPCTPQGESPDEQRRAETGGPGVRSQVPTEMK